MQGLRKRIAEVLRLSLLEKRWRNVARFFAFAVVFCTTYMLILPAITMEKETFCSLQEHTHEENCYVIESKLICPYEEVVTTDKTSNQDSTATEETTAEETTAEETTAEETTAEETTTAETTAAETTAEEITTEETTEAVHKHTEECYEYTETLICDLTEHTHEEGCFIGELATTEETDVSGEEDRETTSEEVSSDVEIQIKAQQQDEWKEIIYDYAADLDKDTLSSLESLSQEDRYRTLKMNYLSETLPEYDEFIAELDRFYEEEDAEGEEAYYTKIKNQTTFAYAYYQCVEDLYEYIQKPDKLLDLWDYFSNSPQAYVTETTSEMQFNFINYNYGNVNKYDTSVITPVIIHGTSPSAAYGVGEWWRGIVVEYNSDYDYYYVSKVKYDSSNVNTVYSLEATTDKGFIIMIWADDPTGAFSLTASVTEGDIVNVSFDPTTVNSGYKSSGYGTISFSPSSELVLGKEEKDNTDELHIAESVDTYNLITVNLYDYGSNINDYYKKDTYEYPGFQQDYGTRTTLSSILQYNFNFGNTVTADLLAGITNVTSTAVSGSINKSNTTSPGNMPTEGTMGYVLGEDGYPQTINGTSLAYLFSDNVYAKKQNTDNINGLFQQVAETGEYYYNSRLNHAQFDPESNTFVLYDERITPNFMMYPFGNFMPFFDIVNDSKKSSEIDGDYLLEIAKSANYKYKNGEGVNQENGEVNEYLGLYRALTSFVSIMDSTYSSGWTASTATNRYFQLSGIKDSSGNYVTVSDEDLSDLYTLDYDEPSDFYFGMDMEMNFMQPKDGLTGTTGEEELVFYFTGDDDVWVYIDNVLFLDLSGIHRHVGGKIDFVNGVVTYYELLTSTGDVSEEPYKEESFEEILIRAGQSTETLNSIGTFKNYTLHNFKFYYMERGSGSGVCRMNFNLPLVDDNTITVTKEISTEDGELLKVLGDPDYKFMIKKAVSDSEKTDELFFAANTKYQIVDSAGNWIRDAVTDEEGVITVKAGETAIFPVTEEMLESDLRYYVCELIDSDISGQYGDIYVDNEVVKKEVNGIVVSGETFDHFHSNIKNVMEGDTSFYYDNLVTFSELGALQITKEIVGEGTEEAFDFEVAFDSIPIQEGTEYTHIAPDGTETTATVETEGIISLKANESALIEGLLAGSVFTVSETDESRGDYTLYFAESEHYTTDGDTATGIILPASTIKPIVLTATNTERGACVEVSGTKSLTYADGMSHNYNFVLSQVTDPSGETSVDSGKVMEKEITVNGEAGEPTSADYSFVLNYYDSVVSEGTQKYYYKLYEKTSESLLESTIFDTDIYVIEVTVTKNEQLLTAELTAAYKNGELTENYSFDFENTLIGQLTVSKQVVDAQEFNLEQTSFPFEVYIEYEGQSLNGSYSLFVTDSSDNVTESTLAFEQGKATVNLCHGESFTLKGIPITSQVTVTETAEGFYSYYTVNGEEEMNISNVAQLTISSGNNSVEFTNITGHVLPETGGNGTYLYIIGGLLTALSSVFLLCYKNYRGRRRKRSKA